MLRGSSAPTLFALTLFALCSAASLSALLAPATARAQTFTISIDPITIPYEPDTGIGSATTSIRIAQMVLPGEPIFETAGFLFAYSHDSAVFQTIAMEFAGPLLLLNGGSGPGLGEITPFPDGGSASAVFNLLAAESIPFGTAEIVASVTFTTTPAHWIGNTTGGTATFSTANPAGQIPPYNTYIVIQGTATETPMTWNFPTIEFEPIVEFIRGDADGDGSIIAVGDAITILGGLFSGETIPCEAAADTNSDDAINLADPIYLLNYGFGGGPPPDAPFPDCGKAAGASALDCAQSGC